MSITEIVSTSNTSLTENKKKKVISRLEMYIEQIGWDIEDGKEPETVSVNMKELCEAILRYQKFPSDKYEELKSVMGIEQMATMILN